MPCPDKVTVKAYLTPEEHQIVAMTAGRAGLSVSGFVRAACLGNEIKEVAFSESYKETVKALLKLNGDLGRVGGLLKMALGKEIIGRARGNELLEEISETRRRIKVKLESLGDSQTHRL